MNRDQLEKCRTYFMNKFDWFDDNQIRVYTNEYEYDYLGLYIQTYITETQEFLDRRQSFFIEFNLISRFKKSSDHNLSMFSYFKKFLLFDSIIRNYTYENTMKRKDELKKKNNFFLLSNTHAASFIVEPILPSQQLINTI